MTPDHLAALALLSRGHQRFFVDFKQRNLFAQLVMQGYARCYVLSGGEEWIRLATDKEKAAQS